MRDVGHEGCRTVVIQTGRMGTGGMLDTRDAGHEGCRTRWMQAGGMQERWDAGQVGCTTGEEKDRRDAGQK